MRKLIFGAMVASLCGAANATTYIATIQGTVTSRFDTVFTDPNAGSTIKIGDPMSATFTYNTGDSVSEMMARMIGANRATFKLGDFTWTSAGDFLAPDVAPKFAIGADPLKEYYSTMDDAPGGGDLRVNGYAFTIGEFGYDLYTGSGFGGVFDASTLSVNMGGTALQVPAAQITPMAITAVPEPATWAMMISGFGLAGAMLRRRSARRLAA